MTGRNEELSCTSCGSRFLFTAVEAALYAQRGLAPPKRCKACRRARKNEDAGGGATHAPAVSDASSGGRGGSNRRGDGGGRRGDRRGRGPRSRGGPPTDSTRDGPTGNVNEYRSP